ncbi:MAG: hypothetical protein K2Y21_02705 [Phycisphaerales bacterium]|nr:hypothetical protein [Phycisphaerales bacterium]
MRAAIIGAALGLIGFAGSGVAAWHSDEPALLAGPKVAATDRRLSLVHIGADGMLAALDDREEIAAVDLLELTPAERDPIDRLLRLRIGEVMSGGLAKIPILLELQEAIASGEDDKVDDVLQRFGVTRPTWANPTPLDEIIEAALPGRARRAYRAIVDEYRAAWLEQQRRTEPGRGRGLPGPARASSSMTSSTDTDAPSDEALLAKLEREKKLADIRRPTDAALAQARERFKKISRRLDLSPDQEGRIQTLIQEYATGTNFKPKPRDGLKLLGDLFGVLTWKQRAEMARYLREENTKPRWRPLRDSPQGTLMAAGLPVMLVVGRRKRKRNEPRA